jgi:hypothetical protein
MAAQLNAGLETGNGEAALLQGLTPAMRKSIERQARLSALVTLLMLWLSTLYVARSVLPERSQAIAALAAAALTILGLFLAPAWSRRAALKRELRYRLKTGKWRWDR